MSKKKIHEEYVAELTIKNPTIEVIGKYVNSNTKIMHRCLIHDVYWETTPSRVLHGVGCELCRKEKFSISKCKTNEQYVAEVNIKNPDILVIEPYIDARTPILHRCTIHNIEWKAYPDNILRGCGCWECGNEKNGNKKRKSNEQYIKELKSVNPDIIPIDVYIDSLTPILHKCLIDGYEWYATPANILWGYGCPQCSESSGERQIRQWLSSHNIKYIYQKIFKDCRDIKPLPFDFYLPKYNACIEYDGGQHYKPISCFGGEEAFNRTVEHDNIKTNYCKDNNITLLRIPYFKDVEEELNNFLFI
jgi:hypothetical protein